MNHVVECDVLIRPAVSGDGPLHKAMTGSAFDRHGFLADNVSSSGCMHCPFQHVCIPAQLEPIEILRFSDIVRSTRQVKEGGTLYRSGDVFTSIYAIRTGCFKTVIVGKAGQEQISGFHLPGEFIGLDGIFDAIQACDAVAMQASSACVIPFGALEKIAREYPAIQRHLHRMLSREIRRESTVMTLLGTMSADQRLATFLLNMSERLSYMGHSSMKFKLPMTRDELGSYLGIKLETVSRMFSRFQRMGLLSNKGRHVFILDPKGLADIGG
jgi:CRP/FNR family transcriptional regulator